MIQTALEAAHDAGKILLQHLGTVRHVEIKDNQAFNLVTEADKASEARIVEIIRRKYPKHGILAEEGGGSETDSPYKWLIDPLDGTTNFAHGLPLFSISIALEYEGHVIAGCVYDPVRGEMFHAEAGGGAFLNNRPIRVSEVSHLSKALLVTGFPYNVQENPDSCHERFISFLMHAQAVRRLGSAALDAAYVASGRMDGFWEVALQPWDKAAGQILIVEAGGRVTDFDGGMHDLYRPQFLGSNGQIHSQMIDVLRKSDRMKSPADRTR